MAASDLGFYLGTIQTGDFTYHGRLVVDTTCKSVVRRKIGPVTGETDVMNFRFKTTKTVRVQDMSLLLVGSVYSDTDTVATNEVGSGKSWDTASDGISSGPVWLPGGWMAIVQTRAKINDVIIDTPEGPTARYEKYFKYRFGRHNPSLKVDEGFLAGIGWFEDDINRRGDYYDKTASAPKTRTKNVGAETAHKYLNGKNRYVRIPLGGVFGNSFGTLPIDSNIDIEVTFKKINHGARAHDLAALNKCKFVANPGLSRLEFKEYVLADKLASSLLNEQAHASAAKPMVFPSNKWYVEAVYLPSGATEYSMKNVLRYKVPTNFFVTFVRATAFNDTAMTNPYWMDNKLGTKTVQSLQITMGESVVGGEAIIDTSSYEKTWLRLLENSGRSGMGYGIRRYEFEHGFWICAVDMSSGQEGFKKVTPFFMGKELNITVTLAEASDAHMYCLVAYQQARNYQVQDLYGAVMPPSDYDKTAVIPQP